MPRLALDISIHDNALAPLWQRYDFDRKFVAQIVQALGQDIVLGDYGPRGQGHLGRARIESIAAARGERGGEGLVAVLGDVALFDMAMPSALERPGRDVPYVWLTDAEAAQADLAATADAPTPHAEAEEAAAPSLDLVMAVHNQVLHCYGFSCAFTGRRFPPSAGLHPELDVVAIRPLAEGGHLHVDNCLPAVAPASDALLRGQIAVEDDLTIIANLSVAPMEVLAQMHPLGRLVVPKGVHPARDNLAFHRERVFRRAQEKS